MLRGIYHFSKKKKKNHVQKTVHRINSFIRNVSVAYFYTAFEMYFLGPFGHAFKISSAARSQDSDIFMSGIYQISYKHM